MWAQLPNTTAGELGTWAVGLAAVMAIIVLALTMGNQWKKLVAKPARPQRIPGTQYVTKTELDQLGLALRGEIQRIEKAQDLLNAQVRELQTYVRERFHELSNSVAAMPTAFRKMLDDALLPLNTKTDRNSLAIAKIATKMGINSPNPGEQTEE